MANQLRIKYYSDAFLKLHCAQVRGRKIFAKPIFVLSVIQAVEDKVVTENQFEYGKGNFEQFHKIYKDTYMSYQPNEYLTPIFKPYFHLTTDGFWHHKVSDDNIPRKSSTTYLKENVSYAYLDEALWDLLQEPSVREQYRELIVNFFLSPKTEE